MNQAENHTGSRSPARLLVWTAVAVLLLIAAIAGTREMLLMDRERVAYQRLSIPSDELIETRTRESQTLNSYAVLDEENGIYRIPIKRAMELMAEDKR